MNLKLWIVLAMFVGAFLASGLVCVWAVYLPNISFKDDDPR